MFDDSPTFLRQTSHIFNTRNKASLKHVKAHLVPPAQWQRRPWHSHPHSTAQQHRVTTRTSHTYRLCFDRTLTYVMIFASADLLESARYLQCIAYFPNISAMGGCRHTVRLHVWPAPPNLISKHQPTCGSLAQLICTADIPNHLGWMKNLSRRPRVRYLRFGRPEEHIWRGCGLAHLGMLLR